MTDLSLVKPLPNPPLSQPYPPNPPNPTSPLRSPPSADNDDDQDILVENVLEEIKQRTASATCDRRTNMIMERYLPHLPPSTSLTSPLPPPPQQRLTPSHFINISPTSSIPFLTYLIMDLYLPP